MALKIIGIVGLALVLVAAFTMSAMAKIPLADNEAVAVKITGVCLDTNGKKVEEGGAIKSHKDLHMRANYFKTGDGVVDFAVVTFFISGKKTPYTEVGKGKFYFDFPTNYEVVPTDLTLNDSNSTTTIDKFEPKDCNALSDQCLNVTNGLINGWATLLRAAFSKSPGDIYMPEVQGTINSDKKRGLGNAMGLPFTEIKKCPTKWKFTPYKIKE